MDFTYVEYYLIVASEDPGLFNQFAPKSFFSSFRMGIDPEYAVMGESQEAIWAKAFEVEKYGATYVNGLKMLKGSIHIQTPPGESLPDAQEIDLMDIRNDHFRRYTRDLWYCNSLLHTNAYDEPLPLPHWRARLPVRRESAL